MRIPPFFSAVFTPLNVSCLCMRIVKFKMLKSDLDLKVSQPHRPTLERQRLGSDPFWLFREEPGTSPLAPPKTHHSSPQQQQQNQKKQHNQKSSTAPFQHLQLSSEARDLRRFGSRLITPPPTPHFFGTALMATVQRGVTAEDGISCPGLFHQSAPALVRGCINPRRRGGGSDPFYEHKLCSGQLRRSGSVAMEVGFWLRWMFV